MYAGGNNSMFPPPMQTNDSFRALITPAVDLKSIITGDPYIEFKIRKKNNTVTLQWEPFECTVSQNGVAYLGVQQTIGQMPAYPTYHPIVVNIKSEQKISYLVIDPNVSAQIKFYLDLSGLGTGVNEKDNIMIPGGSVTWIAAN